MAARRQPRGRGGKFVRKTARRASSGTRAASSYVRRRSGKMDWKRILIRGAGYGLAASIGGYVIGRALGRPIAAELGQRGGAIIASKYGGWQGQVAFQVADALFDRGIVQRQLGGLSIQSGTVNTA